METPLVSVCIPTYNRSEYLAECLQSVIAQTYTNWECIVVDDGSTDSTPTLLKWFSNKDSRITVVHQENSGIAVARNTAIALSKGEYLAVMDSDDIMSPERLSLSVKALEKSGKDVVHSAFLRADEHAKVIDGVLPVPKVRLQEVENNQLPAHVTIMAKRKCFIEHPYRAEFRVNDDQALLQSWFLAKYSFKALKDPLMIVRFHPQSTSQTRDAEVKMTQDTLRKELHAATTAN